MPQRFILDEICTAVEEARKKFMEREIRQAVDEAFEE
jgi:hypothetical protein